MAAKKPKEAAHALLSPSGASRWLACSPSARLEEQFPDGGSQSAAEGTLAHAIAELKLRKAVIEPMGPRKFANALKKLQEDPLYEKEMLEHTDFYVEYITGLVHGFSTKPYIQSEQRLDCSAYAPECFGTADCIIIGGDVLQIVDFKYGKRVSVNAAENKQMMLYALGAYDTYSFLYPLKTVRLSIVQPRDLSEDGKISEWELPVEDLLSWGDSIKPIAQQAFEGLGEFAPGDATCQFCRAKGSCRARAGVLFEIEPRMAKAPALLENSEIGVLLALAKRAASFAKDLEETALNKCLIGEDVPGWKAVEGRAIRAWTDADEAFNTLENNGVDEALLYERKPLTLAAVEKMLGKKNFTAIVGDFVTTPPGKPALAPESDQRIAVTNRITPEEAFTQEEEK